MKNTIRCCISCILPCGALDVIRIVHTNGRVEEISGTIRAAEVLRAYPKHVLKKPSSAQSDTGCCPKIVVVPPDAELQRGKIYFLIPIPPAPEKSRSRRKKRDTTTTHNNINNYGNKSTNTSTATTTRSNNNNNNNISLLVSDRYLSEILSEKLSTQKDRRRGRAGVWRPHLESICETTSEV